MNSSLWEKYLDFLIDYCGLETQANNYWRLFSILHNIPFSYSIEMDENREYDGRDLRKRFPIPRKCEKRGLEAFQSHPTSVMEVLVGIAVRLEREYIGDPADVHPELFFMDMIENLGLITCHGFYYPVSIVTKKIDRWLSRGFEKNGFGSPFPVKHDSRDQRNLEMWDQINSYVAENYYGLL